MVSREMPRDIAAPVALEDCASVSTTRASAGVSENMLVMTAMSGFGSQ